jgi:hypothetical protein
MTRIAILDDYQGVALRMADWGSLPADAEVVVFRDHLADPDAVATRLRDFDVVMAMRERTPFPRALLTRLSRLRLLVTAGMRNAAIDLRAAAERGVLVCGTAGLPYPTAELTWGLILSLVRRIPREDRATREGRWQETVGLGVNGKTLGCWPDAGPRHGWGAFEMPVLARDRTHRRACRPGGRHPGRARRAPRSDAVTIHPRASARAGSSARASWAS